MSRRRYVVLSLLIGALCLGWIGAEACSTLLAQFQLPDSRVLSIAPASTLVGVLIGFGSLVWLLRNREVVRFTDEVIHELGRVTWPTREETMQAASTVLVTTFLVASLLSIYDFVWSRLAALFLFNEG